MHFWKAGIALLIVGISGPAEASSACKTHGGVVGCDSSGQVLCKDGAVDRKFNCDTVKKRVRPRRVVKFKPRPNRGQIVKPGEAPPAETLEQSHREMTQP
jgi:hypothetical protein